MCSSHKITPIYFLSVSKVWSMFHDGSVWLVHKKILLNTLSRLTILKVDHILSVFLKAVFHKVYLVHSWILCLKYISFNISFNFMDLEYASYTLQVQLRLSLSACIVLNWFRGGIHAKVGHEKRHLDVCGWVGFLARRFIRGNLSLFEIPNKSFVLCAFIS